jgi:hypothetical protein
MGKPNDQNKAITVTGVSPEIIEKVLLGGDLSELTPEERLHYYKNVCETLHLNPLTKPFDYIVLDQKLVLYATKDCAAQLRKRNRISITITSREQQETIYVVTAKASLKTVSSTEPREDESLGAVSIIARDGQQFKGTALGNAVMKAETKAKRRVTLSICGLGMLDEGEVEDYEQPPPATPPAAIVERNVKEAAANATGEGERTDYSNRSPLPPPVTEPTNEHGPLTITPDNYKQLKSHIGKAQGNMLGVAIGNLHDDVIKWMHGKWRDKLTPSASEQDLRLKKAIEFAYADRFRIAGDTISGGGAVDATGQGARERDPVKPPPDQPHEPPDDPEAKAACVRDLRQRAEDLVITEEQLCGYLNLFGLFAQGWKTLDQAPLKLLLYISTPEAWRLFTEAFHKEVAPKVDPTLKLRAKKGRGRKR